MKLCFLGTGSGEFGRITGSPPLVRFAASRLHVHCSTDGNQSQKGKKEFCKRASETLAERCWHGDWCNRLPRGRVQVDRSRPLPEHAHHTPFVPTQQAGFAPAVETGG